MNRNAGLGIRPIVDLPELGPEASVIRKKRGVGVDRSETSRLEYRLSQDAGRKRHHQVRSLALRNCSDVSELTSR